MNLSSEEKQRVKQAMIEIMQLCEQLGLTHDLAESTLVVSLCSLIAGRYKDRASFDRAADLHLEAMKTLMSRARKQIQS